MLALMGAKRLNGVMTNLEQGHERISDEALFTEIATYLDERDLDPTQGQPPTFHAFHMAYWLLETYGQQDSSGTWYLSTSEEGFKGDELPEPLQNLIMTYRDGALRLNDGNTVNVISQNTYIEHDPVIPKWEELEQIETYNARLERIVTDPEIFNGLVPSRVEVLPEVSVAFRPYYSEDWGIEFVINERSVRLAPFGARGKTWRALDFVQEYSADGQLLSKLAGQLVLLAAQFSWLRLDHRNSSPRSQPKEIKDRLHARWSGSDKIPVTLAGFQPKPANAVKSLLIAKALKSR